MLIAALACDLAVVELPAPVGLDAQTPHVWELLGVAGLPRAVVVSRLGAATADFDDIAAIAQRMLGEECVAVRLPVFDDDDSPAASLDLTRGVLDTVQGQVAAEGAHLTVAAGDLSALLSVMAAAVPDDVAAGRYIELLAKYSDQPQLQQSDTGTSILLGMPSLPDAPAGLPSQLASDVAAVVSEGLLVPIVADSPEGAWVHDLAAWTAGGGAPEDRLVRRDADGQPTDGWAGVVLAVVDETALIRPVYGAPAAGYALITAVGSDADGTPVPHRAWPTELALLADGPAPDGPAPDGPATDSPQWWATTVRMSVGDTVASGHVWLVPAE